MTSDQQHRRVRVALLFGGRSSEHAVSCATAAGVMRAIDRTAYDIIPIGIAPDGRWVVVADDPRPLELTATNRPEVPADAPSVLVPTSTRDRTLRALDAGEIPSELGEVDVVFPVLHGPYGEDGTVQGLLELADIRYVGSGVLASAVGMDKHFMKVVFAGAGLRSQAFIQLFQRFLGLVDLRLRAGQFALQARALGGTAFLGFRQFALQFGDGFGSFRSLFHSCFASRRFFLRFGSRQGQLQLGCFISGL